MEELNKQSVEAAELIRTWELKELEPRCTFETYVQNLCVPLEIKGDVKKALTGMSQFAYTVLVKKYGTPQLPLEDPELTFPVVLLRRVLGFRISFNQFWKIYMREGVRILKQPDLVRDIARAIPSMTGLIGEDQMKLMLKVSRYLARIMNCAELYSVVCENERKVVAAFLPRCVAV